MAWQVAFLRSLTLAVAVFDCGDDHNTAPGEGNQLEPESSEWGPLAVIEGRLEGGTDEGQPPGTLRISEECVTYEGATLVWRDSQVRWREDERQIIFDHGTPGSVTLADGDIIGIQDYGIDVRADWVARPASSCPHPTVLVNQVTPYTLGHIECQSLTPTSDHRIRMSNAGRCP